MKFTFKTEAPSGKYRAFRSTTHHIKLKRKEVGRIGDESPYKIHFCVIKDDINEDGNPNCIWKWVTLKRESDSLDDAKEFLNRNFKAITDRYNLYALED